MTGKTLRFNRLETPLVNKYYKEREDARAAEEVRAANVTASTVVTTHASLDNMHEMSL